MIQYLPNYVPNLLDISGVSAGTVKWDMGNDYYQMNRSVQYGGLPNSSPTSYDMFHARYDHDNRVSTTKDYTPWASQMYGRANADNMLPSQTPWSAKQSATQPSKPAYQQSPIRERPTYNELRMNDGKSKPGAQLQSPPESPAVHKHPELQISRRLSEFEGIRVGGPLGATVQVRAEPYNTTNIDTRRRSTTEFAGHAVSETPLPLPQMSSRPAPPPRLRSSSPPSLQPPPESKASPKSDNAKQSVIKPIPRGPPKEQQDAESHTSTQTWRKPEPVSIAEIVPKHRLVDSNVQTAALPPRRSTSCLARRRESSVQRIDNLLSQNSPQFINNSKHLSQNSPPSRQPIGPPPRVQRSQTHHRSLSSGVPKLPHSEPKRDRRASPQKKALPSQQEHSVSLTYSPPREPSVGGRMPSSATPGYPISPRSKLQHERDLRKQRRKLEAEANNVLLSPGRLQVFLFPTNPRVGDQVQAFSTINEKQVSDELIYWWFVCNEASEVGECINNTDNGRCSSSLQIIPSYSGRRLKVMALHVNSKATSVTYSDIIR